jgi:pyruvate/2-oxoglutarate dehydrogenase complex dihydrolipoamide acyltransferase (E2) component
MSGVDVVCPDLGDFKDIPIIEVLVKAGERIEIDTPLVTLETDKATMDVPSSAAGKIVEVLVQKGSRVSKGTPLVRLESAESAESALAATGHCGSTTAQFAVQLKYTSSLQSIDHSEVR